MKILLVNPPDTHKAIFPGASDLPLSHHDYSPPLGLMYIRSYLTSNTDHEVRSYNFQIPDAPSVSDFENELREYRPDLVGITVYTRFWYDACQVASLVKEVLPGTLVVAGGPQVDVYPGETLSRSDFDLVVVGEGEITFSELVKCLESGDDLKGLQGIWYKSEDGVLSNPPRPVERNPDRFPFPDRSDFNVTQHRVFTDRWSPAVVMLTSRGCPYRCTFCPNNDRVYRTRRAEQVVDEMFQCKDLGYRSVDFYDANFSQSKSHVESLCREMIERRVNMPWMCQCRVDSIDKELVQLLASAGCERMQIGVESGNQRILDRIKKRITIEQCRQAFDLAKQAGISTVGNFIIGFPGETLEEAKRTISFAFELDPDYAMFVPLFPITGSELYTEALEDPAFGGDYLRDFAANPTPYMPIRIWPTIMTQKQILSLVRWAYFKFYFRPRFIGRTLFRLTSVEDLITKAKAALKIILTG
jgi:radical SAM superfamily enzyme YgiQ (UPF0313 family)